MIDIIKKITFYFLLNVWKCTVFRICIQSFQKVLLWPPPLNFFLPKIEIGIKNAEFYADFEFVDAGFKGTVAWDGF